ncbi:MAG TPA: beta-phosphoglucomutase family hydrolase [Spirochaetota bacterium]|nr:beta-phosphoglucomutase family hydrolase [Spirochaetota bacterium]HOR45249.1 beta-phosphoglucomutase family hydrolase [Spirochaetota bacterium]HOU83893.1 beta-phosphoglucomutase family hydrolase [Spirochaetota bacterium]HPK57351.1 beta-phosphoglucomutase family hydrolase [Spirochaetota bacterium]HQE59736.1 beta-phosphoglucomutase family hydrolase [Spirochaetota bacterium]
MELKVDENAKALIFDIDGTLVDTMEIHYKAWEKMFALQGFNYPREVFYELAGIPTYKIVPILNERFNLKLDPEETMNEKEKYFMELFSAVKEIKVVSDIARKYHGVLPMSLGTGGRKDIAQMTMETVGLSKYFDIMVAAEDVIHHKPAPDTFLKCAELMGVEPRFCQVFEDGELGLQAARTAGMIATDVRPYL